tara:strand:- start:158 stop:406 length:249 start_codon:yes stop_codon:yes gene_type:complete
MIASKEEFNELLNRLKAKNKENKLGKTLQAKLQAFLEVEELINLPISGVGCSLDFDKLRKQFDDILDTFDKQKIQDWLDKKS